MIKTIDKTKSFPICRECGNIDDFQENYSETQTGVRYMDRFNHTQDADVQDSNGYEAEDMECAECNDTNIGYYSLGKNIKQKFKVREIARVKEENYISRDSYVRILEEDKVKDKHFGTIIKYRCEFINHATEGYYLNFELKKVSKKKQVALAL